MMMPKHQGTNTNPYTPSIIIGHTLFMMVIVILLSYPSIQVENKKEEDLERKLDNLTDKLLGSLKTGDQGPDPEEEKSDLGV